ncbi:ATP-dependent Clp protease adapter ClpS [Entomobacter blattae]|uniref:ATP-dependent Clp protease adapter protein ClpS n=1 Tax=Entomobacter blattae TaxID=2762277 RepID=A0A7H1NTJ6_9PROT|nr:ATP-dependent Clp protease adapter ClpS [Entomobacter blattae]QNT79106.1 ATP-dependent Clp protease adapter protein ClpS [Entomobacter blattae]
MPITSFTAPHHSSQPLTNRNASAPLWAPYGGKSHSPSDNEDNNNNNSGTFVDIVVHTRPLIKKPSMYKVLMLNDDYTPMEFVVHVLERFFQKSRDEATNIMLKVHQQGVGVCGVFTYEVAETKVTQVMDLAKRNQHPLQCTIEKD